MHGEPLKFPSDDLTIAMLCVLFGAVGFFFGYALPEVACGG